MVELMKKNHTWILAVLAMLTIGLGFLFFHEEIQTLLSMIISDQAHPAVLIGCFLILPMMFFPITALLVVIGIRFDAFAGMLIMFMVMPAHLLFSFFVVRSIFGSRIERFARKKNHAIFNIPANRRFGFVFFFMAVPGLPYAVKNYLLPVSGIPFREYFLISWLVNGVMGIPFVILGHAASTWSIHMVLIYLLLLVAVYFIAKQVRKKYAHTIGSVADR
jgi:uncharacterized membrane protein YdjX (TVP38/TMEM64 family)